jgi:hypothetical protein
MKKKRVYISKIKFDILNLLIFWLICHFAAWYSNGFTGLYSSKLIFLSSGVTILLLLLLSNSGSAKNDTQIGLPFINSYVIIDDEHIFNPGGFNLFIRILYFLIALGFVFASSLNEKNNPLGLFEFGLCLIIVYFILNLLMKYLKNRKDFISITKTRISWLDNQEKKQINIDFNQIQSYETENLKYKTSDYPKKIIIKTPENTFYIDLAQMSILQFSVQIIDQIKKNLDS